nr:restriction endonuclease [Streptomyces sp. SID5468]
MFVGVTVVGAWIASFDPLGVVIWMIVAAVVVGVVRNRRRQAAFARERQRIRELRAREIATYLTMTPREFEEAVAHLCRRDGCRDVRVVGGAGDLGADVVATTPQGHRLVIQCKRYSPTNKVGSPDLQRFGGTCWTVHHAEIAAVVTTSSFTRQAAQYAVSQRIHCYDREWLAGWASGSGPAPWMVR